jgi:hypothetical protein
MSGRTAWLDVPAALLTELVADPDACGRWAAVVADVADHYTRGGLPE